MVPELVGKIAIREGGGYHRLVATAPNRGVKAQLDWIGDTSPAPWVIARSYPGRDDAGETPSFAFGLREGPRTAK